VGVYLGRDQVLVAEQFLDAAQIGSGIEHVGGVAMPQFVRGKVRIETGDGEVFFEAQLDLASGDRSTFFVTDKEHRGVAPAGCSNRAQNCLMALRAVAPTGTSRSFFPLPRTRTRRSLQSIH